MTEIGHAHSEQMDRYVERAVCFLVDRMGVEIWKDRRQSAVDRLNRKLLQSGGAIPLEGISLRDRQDEIAWYIFLAEQSIADPTALETDQASRVLPYFNALGRKLDALLQIHNIDDRLRRLLARTRDQDPDQGIFELLVGARYAEEGWNVEAVPECASKTPDFIVRKGDVEFDVECKRFSRRPEYSEGERNAWLRQWDPVCRWLVDSRLPLLMTIIIHVEVTSLPRNHLVGVVQKNIHQLLRGQVIEDSHGVTIRATPIDQDYIQSALKADFVKCSSSRERQVITGKHAPDMGLTYAIRGSRVSIGECPSPANMYWDKINFAVAALWCCDAEASINSKARSIVKRLSEANGQLSGNRPGIVHLGIEALEGDQVERLRFNRTLVMLHEFDPRSKPLKWVIIHYLKGEAPPDGLWAIDETHYWQRMGEGEEPRPLSNLFVVLPPSADSRPGVHWEQS